MLFTIFSDSLLFFLLFASFEAQDWTDLANMVDKVLILILVFQLASGQCPAGFLASDHLCYKWVLQ